MADGRMGVGATCGRLGRVFPSPTMHLVKVFGLQIVRFEIFIGNRPGRRDTVVVLDFTEVLATQTKERCTVKLRIASDVVVGVGMQGFAILVVPYLLRVVLALHVDGTTVPVVLFPSNVAAPLHQKDLPSLRSEPIGESAPSSTCSDDDYVIMVL
jgi:hypothetical protein